MAGRPCKCKSPPSYTGLFMPSKTVAAVSFICTTCGMVWNVNMSPEAANKVRNESVREQKENGHGG